MTPNRYNISVIVAAPETNMIAKTSIAKIPRIILQSNSNQAAVGAMDSICNDVLQAEQ